MRAATLHLPHTILMFTRDVADDDAAAAYMLTPLRCFHAR